MKENISAKEWITIPMLPCVSVTETVAFWEKLGYTTTYLQTRPYQYGVVERNGYALHFIAIKGIDAVNSYTGCLVMVNDAAMVYNEFTGHFKQHYGRVLHSGIPRISRMKPGATRFTLTDVSGNAIIFISYGEKDQEEWEEADKKAAHTLQKAIAMARRFRDYKNDDDMAAKTLDAALNRKGAHDQLELAEVLVMRIELAVAMGNEVKATQCRDRLDALHLTAQQLEDVKKRHGVERL
jgi:hypothetical protein